MGRFPESGAVSGPFPAVQPCDQACDEQYQPPEAQQPGKDLGESQRVAGLSAQVVRDERRGIHRHRKDLDGLGIEPQGVHGSVLPDTLDEQGRQFVSPFLEGLDGDLRPDVQETGVIGPDLLDLHRVHLPHGQGQDVLHERRRDLREGQDRAVRHPDEVEAVEKPVRHQDGVPGRHGPDERPVLQDDTAAGIRRGGVLPRDLRRCRNPPKDQGRYEDAPFHRLWKRAMRFLT